MAKTYNLIDLKTAKVTPLTAGALTSSRTGVTYDLNGLTAAELGNLNGKEFQVSENENNIETLVLSGGEVSSDKTKITKLKKVKTTLLDFKGKLAIKSPKDTGNAKVANLNVSIGNWNENKHWILNMSERINGEKSKLDVAALMDWVNGNKGDSALALPADPDSKDSTDSNKQLETLKGFIIEFEAMFFNLSTGEYNIHVESEKGSTLTILDNFQLSDISFRMTNMEELTKKKTEIEI